MPSLQEVQAIQILEAAIASPCGIIVEVSSNEILPHLTHRAKGLLYKIRKGKPAYSHLVIKIDPFLPELAIYDPLGGGDARQTALDTYINDRVATKHWFEARASGQTAIQIIEAQVQDQHDFEILAAACRAFPTHYCDS